MSASAPDQGLPLLLHACCGPCSITSVLRLRDMGYWPTLFFFNPNIHPLSEYLRRREGLLAVAERLGAPVLLPDQEDASCAWPGQWLELVSSLGPGMADMARRCPLCYRLRLEATAVAARRLGFQAICSTLLYSRYQNQAAILAEGEAAAGQDVTFLGEDFRPGWQEGIRLSKEWGVYRQQYCGCLLSEHERYAKGLVL